MKKILSLVAVLFLLLIISCSNDDDTPNNNDDNGQNTISPNPINADLGASNNATGKSDDDAGGLAIYYYVISANQWSAKANAGTSGQHKLICVYYL